MAGAKNEMIITVQQALAVVDAEPELPGEMPDEYLEAMRLCVNDKEAATEFCRILVRCTKDSIKKRLQVIQ